MSAPDDDRRGRYRTPPRGVPNVPSAPVDDDYTPLPYDVAELHRQSQQPHRADLAPLWAAIARVAEVAGEAKVKASRAEKRLVFVAGDEGEDGAVQMLRKTAAKHEDRIAEIERTFGSLTQLITRLEMLTRRLEDMDEKIGELTTQLQQQKTAHAVTGVWVKIAIGVLIFVGSAAGQVVIKQLAHAGP